MKNTKFIVTLRNPSTRFESQWVGAHDNIKHTTSKAQVELGGMSCNRAWASSLNEWNRCLKSNNSNRTCSELLHENPIVRGIYVFQLERWLEIFPPNRILVIQAEHMFKNLDNTLQHVTRFLKLRYFTAEELSNIHKSLNREKGSSHLSEPLHKQCTHLVPEMNAFFKPFDEELRSLINQKFPWARKNWLEEWR